MITFLLADLPLGLSGIKIALHLLNFVILMTGLTFLLYKPIKKFIKGRQEKIANQIKENEKAKADAETLMKDYQTKMDKADAEIEKSINETHLAVENEKEAILNSAHRKANDILKKAEEECAAEQKKAICSLKNEVAEVAVNLASNILEREIKPKEHEKIIDDCINEWSEND